MITAVKFQALRIQYVSLCSIQFSKRTYLLLQDIILYNARLRTELTRNLLVHSWLYFSCVTSGKANHFPVLTTPASERTR